jgi:predicted ribosome quality control (RQC) complex YloA/Tae2 family protein
MPEETGLQQVVLEIGSTGAQNAAVFFDKSKKAKLKLASLEAAYVESKQRLLAAQEKKEKTGVKVVTKLRAGKKEWYQRFHHFFTTSGKLAVGGKSATDNEFLVSAHLEENDLFFHADITGAAAVVLKNGKDASKEDLVQTAQFAACFSRAWKSGAGAVDVYAVEKDAVSRTSHGEYVPKGGFMIRGTRQWFKNTPLEVAVLEIDGRIQAVPATAAAGAKKVVRLKPGPTSKLQAAKEILRRLANPAGFTNTDVEAALPGNCTIE